MSYTQLTEVERYQIQSFLKADYSQKAIAHELDRSPATVSREIYRNAGLRGYRPQRLPEALDLIIDFIRPVLLDVAVPKILANNGGVFTFDQRIIIAFSGAGFGKIYLEFFQQSGHVFVDVFRAVVSMKTPYFKG